MPTPHKSSLYRAVNERILDVSTTWAAGSEPVGFLCECGDENCYGVLNLTIRDFEAIRSAPNQFLVLRGHQTPDVDNVLAQNNGYLVIARGEPNLR
jgi:hypothetical protein